MPPTTVTSYKRCAVRKSAAGSPWLSTPTSSKCPAGRSPQCCSRAERKPWDADSSHPTAPGLDRLRQRRRSSTYYRVGADAGVSPTLGRALVFGNSASLLHLLCRASRCISKATANARWGPTIRAIAWRETHSSGLSRSPRGYSSTPNAATAAPLPQRMERSRRDATPRRLVGQASHGEHYVGSGQGH